MDDLETIARTIGIAEAACFDSVFLADVLFLAPQAFYDETRSLPDALVMISAITALTKRIGVIATVSTTFAQPYDVARKFATLARISKGRAAWNIVTSAAEADAKNFGGLSLASPEERYARATEFVEVTRALWDSYPSEALLRDKASGVYADPERVKPINHKGRWFEVAGPLNVPTSPYGHPVLVQAGQSESGRDFGARYAELIFTVQKSMEESRAFTEDMRARAVAHGRGPDALRILPGFIPILGSTEAEAKELENEIAQMIRPDQGFEAIRLYMGFDMSSLDPEEPVPDDLDQFVIGKAQVGSRDQMIRRWIKSEQPTVRQLMAAADQRGHLTIAGTPEQIADRMQEWFEAGACDGFTIGPSLFPLGLEQFAGEVVPILQERGLFRTEYTGTTLREHCGLEQPVRV